MPDPSLIMTQKGELPKATVHNMLKEKFAASTSKVSFSKELIENMVSLAREYVYVLGSQANDVCMKNSRKTISKEHLFGALQAMKMGGQIEQLERLNLEIKEKIKSRQQKYEKAGQSGLQLMGTAPLTTEQKLLSTGSIGQNPFKQDQESE